MWISDKQKDTLAKIKRINNLQKGELIDIVMHLTNKAILIIKDRDGNVEDDITDTLTQLLDETDFGLFKKMFVQAELPDVTLHTIDALERKKVLEESEPLGLDGAVYYKWTGLELE